MTSETVNTDYKVQLEVFEGPLDLLLYLIKKDEVDVYDIPIVKITEQYMEYLDMMKMLDLNIAGDFLVMAATLMMIKSRMLLPVEDRKELDEEDEEDPRWDLVRQLVAYKKFKDAALHLEDLELLRQDVFKRDGEPVVHVEDDLESTMQDVGIFDLITAFNEALRRIKEEQLSEIFSERFTVSEKIDSILSMIRTDKKKISISNLFVKMQSRTEIVCTFLAVLELLKLSQIRLFQDHHFGEIVIEPCEV